MGFSLATVPKSISFSAACLACVWVTVCTPESRVLKISLLPYLEIPIQCTRLPSCNASAAQEWELTCTNCTNSTTATAITNEPARFMLVPIKTLAASYWLDKLCKQLVHSALNTLSGPIRLCQTWSVVRSGTSGQHMLQLNEQGHWNWSVSFQKKFYSLWHK